MKSDHRSWLISGEQKINKLSQPYMGESESYHSVPAAKTKLMMCTGNSGITNHGLGVGGGPGSLKKDKRTERNSCVKARAFSDGAKQGCIGLLPW